MKERKKENEGNDEDGKKAKKEGRKNFSLSLNTGFYAQF